MRIHRRAARVAMRGCRVPLASHRISLGGKRKLYEAFTLVARPAKGMRWESGVVGGIPVERTVGVGATLLYLHGGAYGLGSAATGVEHRWFDGMWHDFHLQAGVLAEADSAIEELGARLRAHTLGKVVNT